MGIKTTVPTMTTSGTGSSGEGTSLRAAAGWARSAALAAAQKPDFVIDVLRSKRKPDRIALFNKIVEAIGPAEDVTISMHGSKITIDFE